MISEKVKKKIDKHWAASKAVIFDWKSAPDEEAAYMMSLYIKELDKKEYDPELLLKFVKVLRYGKFTEPKTRVSPSLREWIYHGTVNGKQYRVGLDIQLEYEGETYPFLTSGDLFGSLLSYNLSSFNVSNTFERIAYNQFKEREKQLKSIMDGIRIDGQSLIEAYAAKARPIKKVQKKVVENLTRVIMDNFSEGNRNRIEMIEGIIWLMKEGRWEHEIEGFLTGLRRNRDSVNAITAEMFAEIRDILTIQEVTGQ